ncbi:hypothetical protein CKA32_002885 [Geitlerinema sp. FC II]|nr:hypothetical protein CKA32_002885 [Geitlerinema sp. FC II]
MTILGKLDSIIAVIYLNLVLSTIIDYSSNVCLFLLSFNASGFNPLFSIVRAAADAVLLSFFVSIFSNSQNFSENY